LKAVSLEFAERGAVPCRFTAKIMAWYLREILKAKG
jgi:hypothetical protein